MTTPRTWRAAVLLWGLPLWSTACLRDFAQFDPAGAGGDAGDGGAAQVAPDAKEPATGGRVGEEPEEDDPGDSLGGGRPLAPEDECGVDRKSCDDECVSRDDPATGCSEEGCSPCPNAKNATVGCDEGVCAILSCEADATSCDGRLDSGCEHTKSTFSLEHCGGCAADCSSLGLGQCGAGTCQCTQKSQCESGTNKDVSCGTMDPGRCECGGSVCNAGEVCVAFKGTSRCACGGSEQDACALGSTCCPGAGGAYCAVLDSNDVSNCGACGWQCSQGQICDSGQCVFP